MSSEHFLLASLDFSYGYLHPVTNLALRIRFVYRSSENMIKKQLKIAFKQRPLKKPLTKALNKKAFKKALKKSPKWLSYSVIKMLNSLPRGTVGIANAMEMV